MQFVATYLIIFTSLMSESPCRQFELGELD